MVLSKEKHLTANDSARTNGILWENHNTVRFPLEPSTKGVAAGCDNIDVSTMQLSIHNRW